MQDDRTVLVLDDRILKYLKFAEFHWIEVLVMVVGLGLLASYAALAWYLDRRARIRKRRRKQRERLDRWLESWQLHADEEAALRELAVDERDLSLYALLADPIAFEGAVHEAIQSGKRLDFIDSVRESLGYHSDNLHIPIASTRQLVSGDHFHFAVWEGGRPQHHYGLVTTVSPAGVAVELTEAGFKAVQDSGAETDLFYLRGNDVEYRFPLVIRSTDRPHNRLLLSHQLVRGGQRARGTRLPIMRAIDFRLHTQLAQQPRPDLEPEPGPEGQAPAPAGRKMRGALLEMSEGGFSLVILERIAEGAYVEYAMPMPRGRTLAIMGRVLDCRSFAGNRWLVRCELRGLTPTQRNTLSQALRLEQQRRIREMQAERRKRRRGETESA